MGPLVHWKIGWQWNEKKIIWFVPKQMMHKNPLKTIKMVEESVVVLNSDLITECKEPMTGQLNCLEPSAVRVSKELYYWTWGAVIYSHLSAEYCQRLLSAGIQQWSEEPYNANQYQIWAMLLIWETWVCPVRLPRAIPVRLPRTIPVKKPGWFFHVLHGANKTCS